MEKFATISAPCQSDPGLKTYPAPTAWTKIIPKFSSGSRSCRTSPPNNGPTRPPATALQLVTEAADSTTSFANFRIRRSGAYSKHKKMKKKFFVLLEHCDPPFDQSRLEYYDIPVKRWLSIVNRLSGPPRSRQHSASHPELLTATRGGETFRLETGGTANDSSPPKLDPATWYVGNAKPRRRIYLRDCFNVDRLRHPSNPDPGEQPPKRGGGGSGLTPAAAFKKSSLASFIHPRQTVPPKPRPPQPEGESYAVMTQGQDPCNCVTFGLETRDEMEAWLEDLWILHQLSTKGLLTFPLAPNYEWVWEVSVRTQGINPEYRLYGSYYVCLNPDDNIFTFYKYRNYYDATSHHYPHSDPEEEEDYYYFQQTLPATPHSSSPLTPYDRSLDPHGSGSGTRPKASQARKDVQIAYIELCSIKRCGHANNFFYVELGRTSSLGPGEIWMHLADNGQAQQIHSLILDRMKGKGKTVYQSSHPSSSGTNTALGTGESGNASESGATPVNTALPARKRLPPLVLSPVGAGAVTPTPSTNTPLNADAPAANNYSSSSSGTLTYLPLPRPLKTSPNSRRTPKSSCHPQNSAPPRKLFIKLRTPYVEMDPPQTTSPPNITAIDDAEWPMTFMKQADPVTTEESTKENGKTASDKDGSEDGHDTTSYAPMTMSSDHAPALRQNILPHPRPKTGPPDPHPATVVPAFAMGGPGGAESSASSDRSRLGSDASAISSTYSYADSSNAPSDHWLAPSSSSPPEGRRPKRVGRRDDRELCKMSLGDRLEYLKEHCRGGSGDRHRDGPLRPPDNLHALNSSEAIFASHDSGYMDMIPSIQQPLPQNSSNLTPNQPQLLAPSNDPANSDQIYASNPRISSLSSDPDMSSYREGVALQTSTPSIASLGSSLASSPFPFSAPAKSCFLTETLHDSEPEPIRYDPASSDSVQELSSKIEKVPGLYFSAALPDGRPAASNLTPPSFLLRTASFSRCSNSTGLLASEPSTSVVPIRVTTSFDVLIDRAATTITPRPRKHASKVPPALPPFPDFFFGPSGAFPDRRVENFTAPTSTTAQPLAPEDEYQSLADRVRAYSLGSRPSPPFISLRSRKKNILKNEQQSVKTGHHSTTIKPSVSASGPHPGAPGSAKKHHPIPPRFPIIEGLIFDSPTSPTRCRDIGSGPCSGTILHNVLIEEAPHETSTP